MQDALAALARVAVTPTPTPSQVDPNTVTPGPWGLVIIVLIAVAVILLALDMTRRIRRGRVRADLREELDAEQQAAAAVEATQVDDESVDAADSVDGASADGDDGPPPRR